MMFTLRTSHPTLVFHRNDTTNLTLFHAKSPRFPLQKHSFATEIIVPSTVRQQDSYFQGKMKSSSEKQGSKSGAPVRNGVLARRLTPPRSRRFNCPVWKERRDCSQFDLPIPSSTFTIHSMSFRNGFREKGDVDKFARWRARRAGAKGEEWVRKNNLHSKEASLFSGGSRKEILFRTENGNRPDYILNYQHTIQHSIISFSLRRRVQIINIHFTRTGKGPFERLF